MATLQHDLNFTVELPEVHSPAKVGIETRRVVRQMIGYERIQAVSRIAHVAEGLGAFPYGSLP